MLVVKALFFSVLVIPTRLIGIFGRISLRFEVFPFLIATRHYCAASLYWLRHGEPAGRGHPVFADTLDGHATLSLAMTNVLLIYKPSTKHCMAKRVSFLISSAKTLAPTLLFAPFIVISLVTLNGCKKGLIAKSPCATPLIYQTNVLASGDDALRYASIYRAPISVGPNDFNVSAIVDTGSANLVINERDYQNSLESTTGKNKFVYKNGIDQAYAINAKDQMDVACNSDLPTRFALTSKEVDTDSFLGLGFIDAKNRPHERYSSPFFDQLVVEHGYQDVFSIALCGPRSTSRIVLGGIDPDMVGFIGNFVPIVEKTDYVIPVLGIRRSDNKKVVAEFVLYDPTDKSGDRVIIDSSSPFLMLPPHIAQALVTEIEGDARALGFLKQFPDNFFRTERSSAIKVVRFSNKSQLKQLPSFEINIVGLDGKAKWLEITPFQYLKEMDTRDPMFRAFAIRDASGDTIFGQPFLESQYTYFDRKNQLIGFANADIACAQ